ncbi:hypothetical protein QFC21_006850 [Naganishia friedmannii]|uniref:Uncharacterized protein n=1 Tax=Naganishia friedmannii TaxID=89922 RepID=A0ACC2UZ41_9TREE|nr:hypothetical protein QFC21_006850 [Naganishia friedmannii]
MSLLFRSKVFHPQSLSSLRLTPSFRSYAATAKIPQNVLAEAHRKEEEDEKAREGQRFAEQQRQQRLEESRDDFLDEHFDMFRLVGPEIGDVYARLDAQLVVARLSKYAWVSIDDRGRYVLAAGDFYFSLEVTGPQGKHYDVFIAQRKGTAAIQEQDGKDEKKSGYTFPYHSRRLLFTGKSVEEAVRLADVLVEKMITGKDLRSKFAAWRHQPCTAPQLDILWRLGADSQKKFKLALTMTKGEVAAMITNAIIKDFEEDPLESDQVQEGEQDHPVIGEFEDLTGSHANFILSNGL